MTIDFSLWPSMLSVYQSGVDMITGQTMSQPVFMSPAGKFYRLVPSTSYRGLENDRMCFGFGHALQQLYESSTGNPREGLTEDDFDAFELKGRQTPSKDYVNVIKLLDRQFFIAAYVVNARNN